MKELRFHPQYRTLLFTTAQDSFNVFRPNLDPDEVEEQEESKQQEPSTIKPAEYAVQSEEDSEEEERRVLRTAKELNKNRRSKSNHKSKRVKKH